MNCEKCVNRGNFVSALLLLGFALSFALLCLGGHSLISYITDVNGSLDASADERSVIIIDAGHGGEDGGATGANGILEKDLNLMISDSLRCLFTVAGYDVLPTRTEDILLYDKNSDYAGKKKVLDLASRLELTRNNNCSLFLSIHMNYYPESKYSGAQVFFSPNAPQSKIIAEGIQTGLRNYIQKTNHRDVKAAGKNIYLLDRMTCPSVLVECGFLSNPEECEKLCNENYRRLLSLVLFCSVSDQIDKATE